MASPTLCVCVCVCVSAGEGESACVGDCVCVCVGEREALCVCVCVRLRDRLCLFGVKESDFARRLSMVLRCGLVNRNFCFTSTPLVRYVYVLVYFSQSCACGAHLYFCAVFCVCTVTCSHCLWHTCVHLDLSPLIQSSAFPPALPFPTPQTCTPWPYTCITS